jgi:hypothetical protein
MAEEWLLAGAGNDSERNRLRHLLDVAPPPDPWAPSVAGSAGSTMPPRRGTGISLAQAQRMARDAAEYDRSMGAG